MSTEHRGALDALSAALTSLGNLVASEDGDFGGESVRIPANPASGVFAAALYECTKVLFDNALCVAAFTEEMKARQRADAHVTVAVTSVLQKISPIVQQLYEPLLESLNACASSGPKPSAVSNEIAKSLREARCDWSGQPHSVVGCLEGFYRRLPQFSNGTRADLQVLRDSLLSHVETSVKQLAPLVGSVGLLEHWHPRLLRLLSEATQMLERSLADLTLLSGLVQEEGLYSIKELQQVHDRLTAVLTTPQSLPWPDSDPLSRLHDQDQCEAIVGNVRALARVVTLRIRNSSMPSHLMSRLVAYLERFARLEILDKLENPVGRSRRPEQVVQAEVDRFVFLEGMYPITHAVAGRGNLDTFIEETRPLFEDAERPGNAALLIELKQALSTGTTRVTTEALVKDAVTDALVQADDYQRHLEANPRWKGHAIFAVVAYDGPTKFRTNDSRVVLVYLGTATPSAGSMLLTFP